MRKHYKSLFDTFAAPFKFKKNLKTMDLDQVDRVFEGYMAKEFRIYDWIKPNIDTHFALIRTKLKEVILSERYNKKGEAFTADCDFTAVWNVLNRYNTKRQVEYFENEYNAFLYLHFSRVAGNKFVESQKDVDKEKFSEAVIRLTKKAEEALEGFKPLTS